jgi:hypothetical protein
VSLCPLVVAVVLVCQVHAMAWSGHVHMRPRNTGEEASLYRTTVLKFDMHSLINCVGLNIHEMVSISQCDQNRALSWLESKHLFHTVE